MNDNQFYFSTLSPDLTLNALESVGIFADSGLIALNSYENRVFQFQDENAKRWVVKFYRPNRWSDEQIREEHAFSFKLLEANIAVSAPEKIDGISLFTFQGFRFALFPFLGGRSFETDNEYQIENAAESLAKIHKIGQDFSFTQRPTIGLNEYLFVPRNNLELCSFVPDNLKTRFFSTLDELIKKITQYWHQDWQPIALHGDCHSGNILWRDEALFVDLDDARNGPAIQDIWMLLNGDLKEKRYQLSLISDAYDAITDFPNDQLKLIECLRGLRMVHHTAWLATRWQDSAFPRAFPWFAEQSYWENQQQAFEKQIAIIEEPPLSLYSQW